MSDCIGAYIERAPEAISGQGGHNTTLRVARTLYNGFALRRDQVFEWLHVYNSRLSDKWTARELEHKADSAVSGTYDKPRGWMRGRDESERRRIVIRPAKITDGGRKPAQKYVLATDATDIPYSQSAIRARTRTHARSRGVSEISVASVADDNPENPPNSGRAGKASACWRYSARKEHGGGILCLPNSGLRGNVSSGGRASPPGGSSKKPSSRWDARVLTGNAQPRTRDEHKAFLLAAFERGDIFDFSNPGDVAEFEKLYRRNL